jgi:hypothetical protein
MKHFQNIVPRFYLLVVLIISCTSFSIFAENAGKSIYLTSSFNGMDLQNDSSQFCYSRSKQTNDFIIFWEAGYGSNPATISNSAYRVDVDNLLNIAEKAFAFYADSLKFIVRGSSKTDNYKMIIRLLYSTNWQANGSGMDNMIGQLTLSANAAQAGGVTVAHEVGHCFQYQTHCDTGGSGWMYGFGVNGAGGNCWWEQCAQWQAFKVYPDQQFTIYNFPSYLANTHLNILDETQRYNNYFIQDYWTYLHGMDFIGRMWRESKYPEDPVETYKRLNNISQSAFNEEIYDCSARFVTWDVPRICTQGEKYIDSRGQCKMNDAGNGYWIVDSTNCVANYGYNVIKLNTAAQTSTLKVYFEGKINAKGFRSYNPLLGGWRFGFVALKNDGTRVYSPMATASYASPNDTLSFDCSADCNKLWLVVSGAPSMHWHHPWDNDTSNDEQWPYQVKFENTNLYGNFTFSNTDIPRSDTLTYNLTLAPATGSANTTYPSTPILPDMSRVCQDFCLQLSDIQTKFGSSVRYAAVNPSGSLDYNSTANAPGHWFGKTGYVTTWGASSYIFSELHSSSFTFNIGQYPGHCNAGDKYTIRQALVYTPSGSAVSYKVVFIFNITIANITAINNVFDEFVTSPVKATIITDVVNLTHHAASFTMRNLDGRTVLQAYNVDKVNISSFPCGLYLVTADGLTTRIYKK